MDQREYIESIEKRYEKYFDVKRNINVSGENFDILASFTAVNNRTLITKNDVVDSYENNEYCLVKSYDEAALENVKGLGEILKKFLDEYVKPHRNHMNSYITGVIVTSKEADIEIEKFIKEFKYDRVYKFYLHGWSEVRLVMVDLSRNIIITNRAGKKVKEVYEFTP